MDKDFRQWLQEQLDTRDWSQADLARKSGISKSQISRIFNGERDPGYETCQGFARAFNLPVREVYIQAGMLPPNDVAAEGFLEWEYIYRQADEETRREMLDLARFLFDRFLSRRKS